MALNDAAKHMMLNAAGGTNPATPITHIALHDGALDTDEISGGSPAYARQAVTWGAAAAGEKANTNAMTFNVPAGATVSHIGFWSASTGGTFLGSQAVTGGSEVFAAQGEARVNIGAAKLTIADAA